MRTTRNSLYWLFFFSFVVVALEVLECFLKIIPKSIELSLFIGLLTGATIAAIQLISIYFQQRKQQLENLYVRLNNIHTRTYTLLIYVKVILNKSNLDNLLSSREEPAVMKVMDNIVTSIREEQKFELDDFGLYTFLPWSKIKYIYASSWDVLVNTTKAVSYSTLDIHQLFLKYHYERLKLSVNAYDERTTFLVSLGSFWRSLICNCKLLEDSIISVAKAIGMTNPAKGLECKIENLDKQVIVKPIPDTANIKQFIALKELVYNQSLIGNSSECIKNIKTLFSAFSLELTLSEKNALSQQLQLVYISNQEYDAAIAEFEQSDSIKTNNVYLLDAISSAYVEVGKYCMAEKCLLQKILFTDKDKLRDYTRLSYIYSKMGLYNKAADSLLKIIDDGIEPDRIYPNIIEYLIIDNRLIKARELLDKYKLIYPNSFSTLYLSSVISIITSVDDVDVRALVSEMKPGFKGCWDFKDIEILLKSESYLQYDKKCSLKKMIELLKENYLP